MDTCCDGGLLLGGWPHRLLWWHRCDACGWPGPGRSTGSIFRPAACQSMTGWIPLGSCKTAWTIFSSSRYWSGHDPVSWSRNRFSNRSTGTHCTAPSNSRLTRYPGCFALTYRPILLPYRCSQWIWPGSSGECNLLPASLLQVQATTPCTHQRLHHSLHRNNHPF